MVKYLMIGAVAWVLCAPVPAQCQTAPISTQWHYPSNRPECVVVERPVKFVWDYVEQCWCAWDHTRHCYGSWRSDAPPSQPPAPRDPQLIARLRIDYLRKLNATGIDRSRISGGFSRGGKPITRDEALRSVQAAAVPDDRGKVRITVIGGTKAQRKEALGIIGSPEWAVVKSYEADHWHVAEYGFVTGGAPTIYVQAADGTVIHRQDNCAGLATALRRVDPKYDGRSDPDLRSALPIGGVASMGIGGGLVGLLWLAARLGLGSFLASRLRRLVPRVTEDRLERLEAKLDGLLAVVEGRKGRVESAQG